MMNCSEFVRIAALAGDHARAAMLHALVDGRALTATELAGVAGVTPQTASSHLAKLAEAGLVQVKSQGRHKYFRLASPSVAHMIESIAQVGADMRPAGRRTFTGPRDMALRRARTCYDHLAGTLGVAITDALVATGRLELDQDAGMLTSDGIAFFSDIGIDVTSLQPRRSRGSGAVLCRPCLDWSERRPHLAGALGASICRQCIGQGWTRQQPGTRSVLVTRQGEKIFREYFGMRLDQ